jgi:predicted transcriptional regulator of viral defense system
VFGRLGVIAEQRWGLVTTRQAVQVGVSRKQMSRLAAGGALVRIVQGVYRMAGAPELEHEQIHAVWLALGGANSTADGQHTPLVVAAGLTAAQLHGIGDFYPHGADFIVPFRRGTRLPGVRLRVHALTPADVGWLDGLPTLTVERTIADLVGQWMDRSLIARAVRDAADRGILTKPAQLIEYLGPLAAPNGYPTGDGHALAQDLLDLAGVELGLTR